MKSEREKREALERFVIDNKNLEELERKISRFNIFEAVGIVRQEIKHSNFIQFLLSPSEKHRLGERLLKNLLMQTLVVQRTSERLAIEGVSIETGSS